MREMYGKARGGGKFARRNNRPRGVIAQRGPVVDIAISTKICG
jgi:hypothetical protein